MNVASVGFIVIVAYCITMINFDFLVNFLLNNKISVNNDGSREMQVSSSVWCHMLSGSRICTFHNLCYRPKENQFLFLLTNNSVVVGLESKEDLQRIKLSSVLDHNVFFMNIVMMQQNDISLQIGNFSADALFLLWRFKRDNIMHVIHDDILPLYMTYLDVCKNVDLCISKYTLGLVDKGEAGPFFELYKLFSRREPLLLHNNENYLCFQEVQAGVLSNSVWFQYGFGKPHGPVKSNLSASLLSSFKKYILHKFNISPKERDNSTIILLNRSLNRKILNKNILVSTLTDTMKEVYTSSNPQVIDVDISTHSLKYLLQTLASYRIVVGMHGSAMILCLFLEPGSVVVEIFPFGIEPQNVSYLKALSNIKGTGIIYRSWVNRNESNSVSHPEAPALLGGINHLSPQKQKLIKEVKRVPAVECCHNPVYLYRMFQDTIVGSDIRVSFLDALTEQLNHSENNYRSQYFRNILMSWYFPSQVERVSCFIKNEVLSVSWHPPINSLQPLTYDVAFILDNDSFSTNTKQCFIQLNVVQTIKSAKVWIKALSQYGEGIDVYSSCQGTT